MLAAMSSARPMNVSRGDARRVRRHQDVRQFAERQRRSGRRLAVARRVAVPDVDRRGADRHRRPARRTAPVRATSGPRPTLISTPSGPSARSWSAPIMPSVVLRSAAPTPPRRRTRAAARRARPMSPAQDSPCASASTRPDPVTAAAGAAEGAEQLPGALADVAEADEADAGVPQRAGLRDRVVVHRRRPHVAAQRRSWARKSRRSMTAAASDVLGDRPLVVKGVGHQHVPATARRSRPCRCPRRRRGSSRSFSAASAISAVNRPPT